MNEIIEARRGGGLPEIQGAVALFAELERVGTSAEELYVAVYDNRKQDVLKHLEIVRSASPDLAKRIAAGRTPAPRSEISLHVAKFLGAMKHLAKVDEAIFVPQMIDDIESVQPTRLGLVTGLQKVRLEAEFFPSIAQVVKAIQRADEVYKFGGKRLAEIPQRIAEAEAFLLRST